MNNTKRLYRSNTNTVLAGVIGGIGEYFDIDPTILRLVYVLVAILTGIVPSVIGYIIAYLIVPSKPSAYHMEYQVPKPEPAKETPPTAEAQTTTETK